MGFCYRRSISLGGGVRLNVSRRGISSVSVGRPGLTLNLRRRGVRATVGLPGTGLFYTTGRAGGGSVALFGLIAAALGSLFWLIGAAARGSQPAQVALGVLAAFVLFASLRPPENGPVASTPASAVASIPAPLPAVAEPVQAASAASAASVEPVPAPVAVAPLPPTPGVVAGANASASMRTTTGAKVRSGPSPQARVLRQLPAGARVEVIGSEGRWARVRAAGNGASGWVTRSLLAPADDLMSKLLDATSDSGKPESVFDPADISAILNASPPKR